jgi:hypothetical protein
MTRTIVSVILGYVVMFVIVFVTLTASYLVLGMERTFQPGTYDVTPLWIFVMLVFSFLAAVVGGTVCRIVSDRKIALALLVALVLVLGLVSAVPALYAVETNAVRAGDVSNLQAVMNAREPKWVSVLLPVVGIIGVVIGGRTKGKPARTH